MYAWPTEINAREIKKTKQTHNKQETEANQVSTQRKAQGWMEL